MTPIKICQNLVCHTTLSRISWQNTPRDKRMGWVCSNIRPMSADSKRKNTLLSIWLELCDGEFLCIPLNTTGSYQIINVLDKRNAFRVTVNNKIVWRLFSYKFFCRILTFNNLKWNLAMYDLSVIAWITCFLPTKTIYPGRGRQSKWQSWFLMTHAFCRNYIGRWGRNSHPVVEEGSSAHASAVTCINLHTDNPIPGYPAIAHIQVIHFCLGLLCW